MVDQDDDGTIFGGEWPSDDGSLSPQEGSPKKHPDDIRAGIAYFLLCLLAGVIAALLVLVLADQITVDELQKLAAVIVSPIVALVGAVTGYYYGRADRD